MACNSPAGMIHIKLFYESGGATVVPLHHAFLPSIESLHTISLKTAFVPVIALSLVKELRANTSKMAGQHAAASLGHIAFQKRGSGQKKTHVCVI